MKATSGFKLFFGLTGDGGDDGYADERVGERREAECVERFEEEYVSAWRVEGIGDDARGAV